MSLHNLKRIAPNRIVIAAFGVAACFAAMSPVGSLVADDDAAENSSATTPKQVEPRKELFSGKVVLLQDALKRRGIKVADQMKLQAVLETESGELVPIAADWRGLAFFQDKKLRDRKIDIVGHRRPGVPYLQALAIYFFNEQGEREEFDYWCDICSIPMYEIKDCECCQGPSRHRYRPAQLPDYLFQQKPSAEKASAIESTAPDSPREKKQTQ